MNYILLLLISQLIIVSMYTPWAILKEDVVLNDDCTLKEGKHFAQMGCACGGLTWEEMKLIHTTSHFAMLDSLISNFKYNVVSFVVINIPLLITIRDKYITLITLITLILSMMSTSGYYNDQNTTMVLPIKALILNGVGFWCQVLVGSLSLSNIILYFTL